MAKAKDLTGQRFGRLIALERIGTKWQCALWLCECDCGNTKEVASNELLRGNVHSCGCLQQESRINNGKKTKRDMIGKTYGFWTVLSFSHVYNRHLYYNCECVCGTKGKVSGQNLAYGHSKSCGCLKAIANKKSGKKRINNIKGQKFGKLLVLEFSHIGDHRAYWLCKCDCEQEKIIKGKDLLSGNTKSCGNCENRVNGQLVSFPQFAIADMLGVNDSDHINYKLGNKYIDIALVEQKIAIEYNGWYWHAHKQREDNDRAIELIDQGWKVLAIKSNTKLPDQQSLDWAILQLSPMTPYKELTLSDWGIGDTRNFIS